MKKEIQATIKVENITKKFKIPKEKRDSLKSYFMNPFRRIRYDQFKALSNVSFEIHKGEFVGIIGRNGSGKSTLLKIINSIYLPTLGKVTVNENIVPFLELGVGFHPELSARENIFLNGIILGMKKKYIEKKFAEIIEFSELEEFIDLPLKNYSSGMTVRLGFAIAIQSDARVFLIDEVLAVGDIAFQRKCIDRIKSFQKQGKTILYVSHNMSQIEDLCDRVVLLDHGKLIADGEKHSVINKYHRLLQKSLKFKKKDKNQIAWINKVEFLDKNNKGKLQFRTGEDIICRIHYESQKQIDKPTFGVALHKSDGTHITGPNTRSSGYLIEKIQGKGYVDYKIKNNPLLSGKYLVTAALFDYSERVTYDYCDKQFFFDIEENNINQFGLVDLIHEWKHKE